MITIEANALNTKDHGLVVVLHHDDKSSPPIRFREAARGAEFDVARGRHFVPRAIWAVVRAQILGTIGVTLVEDGYVKAWAQQEELERTRLMAEAVLRADKFDIELKARGHTLRKYQREGIAWLAARRVGLLTDEMGLGKTVQLLGAVPEDTGVVIFCPASLRGYWRDQVNEWRPDLKPILLEGRGSFIWPFPNEAVICSDSSISGLTDFMLQVLSKPVYLAADEAHMFKDEKSARTRNMATVCERVRQEGGWTVGLTGTPILNRPEELYQLAKVFGCHQLGWGSEPAFKRAFEVGPDYGYGPTYGTPKPEAREGLSRISLRRTRVDVLPELPSKSYQYIPVALPRKLVKILDKIEQELSWTLGKIEANYASSVPELKDDWAWHDLMPGFEGIAQVRKDLASLKFASALEWVAQHEAAGLPVVVFSAHREPVDALALRPGWTCVTGDTPGDERTARVLAFQRGEYRGIAGTIGAMGTGHTLTKAAHCLFIDRTFTPGNNLQAEDRVYRLGQLLPVLISILIGDHPLERRLEKILTKKLELLQAAVA